MRCAPFVLPLLAAVSPAQFPNVSPADRGQLEGNSFTHFPVGRASARMQTLHVDLPGGTVVSGHAYRRDAVGVRGTVPGFTCDMQVTLSISPNLPTQASTSFAANTGANAVVVLPRTLITFPATDRPTLDPTPTFDLLVPYQVPFVMPAQGGTLCVDVEVFGNVSASGTNQNLSIYLDAHEHFADGRSEAAAFRTFQGCPAPGSNNPCYATMSMWRLPTSTRLDVSIRNGVADDGSGTTLPYLLFGHAIDGSSWVLQPNCTIWSSHEVWFFLPGAMNQQGDYDGSRPALPVMPPGHRLWCQAGSTNLAAMAFTFSDALTFVTPALGTLPIPVTRVANSTNQAAATGTVSNAVPVMAFF